MFPLLFQQKPPRQGIDLAVVILGLSLLVRTHEACSQSDAAVMQVARYSISYPSPTLGQQDLLAVSLPLTLPNEITTVGGALAWVINDSGYRLVSADRLTPDVQALLELPLPDVHRQFQALPLKTVISLLAGPRFMLVHDPVHRLISFERCHALEGDH